MFCVLPRTEVACWGSPMPHAMPGWTLCMLSTRDFPHFESTTWKALVLHDNITKPEGVSSNPSALLSWGFCCLLFGPVSGPPGAGDHGQNPRHEGCLGRPGRQKDEEWGDFFSFVSLISSKKVSSATGAQIPVLTIITLQQILQKVHLGGCSQTNNQSPQRSVFGLCTHRA